MNHPLIGERYFFPGGRTPASELRVPVAGAVLACGVHRVDPDGFTVVHFHGGLARWGGGERTLCVFPHGDHNSILWDNYDEYLAEVASFLARVRTGRAAS